MELCFISSYDQQPWNDEGEEALYKIANIYAIGWHLSRYTMGPNIRPLLRIFFFFFLESALCFFGYKILYFACVTVLTPYVMKQALSISFLKSYHLGFLVLNQWKKHDESVCMVQPKKCQTETKLKWYKCFNILSVNCRLPSLI